MFRFITSLLIIISFSISITAQTGQFTRLVKSDYFNPNIENVKIKSSKNNTYVAGNFDNLFYYDESKALSPEDGKGLFIIRFDQNLKARKGISITAKLQDITSHEDCVIILGRYRDSCNILDTTIYSTGGRNDEMSFFTSLSLDLQRVNWINQVNFINGATQTYFKGLFKTSGDFDGNTYVSGIFKDSLLIGDTIIYSDTYYSNYVGEYTVDNYLIGKYNKQGSFNWAKVLHGESGSNVTDNNKFITVIQNRDSTLLTKLDSTGKEVFSKKITDEGFSASTMVCDSKNNVFISLLVNRNTLIENEQFTTIGSWDNAIMKYSSEGDLQWITQIGSRGMYISPCYLDIDSNDRLFSIGSDFKNSVSVGNTEITLDSKGFYIAYWNTDGSTNWIEASNNDRGTEEGKGLSISNGNMFYLFNAETNVRFLNNNIDPVFVPELFLGKIDLARITGISDQFDFDGGCSVNVYPNPFQYKTSIQYTLSKPSHVSLRIFNQKGMVIRTLVDGFQNSENHYIEFDASELASGIYYYQLKTSGGVFKTGMLIHK